MPSTNALLISYILFCAFIGLIVLVVVALILRWIFKINEIVKTLQEIKNTLTTITGQITGRQPIKDRN